MADKKRAVRKWERALLEAYEDHRQRQVFETLYQSLLQWKGGEISNAEMANALHQADEQSQNLYELLNQSRDWLVRVPQFLDEDWFRAWVKENPPPAGYQLG